jgi:hypothetical protein
MNIDAGKNTQYERIECQKRGGQEEKVSERKIQTYVNIYR